MIIYKVQHNIRKVTTRALYSIHYLN